MNALLVAPVIVPFLLAALTIVAGSRRAVQRGLGTAGALSILVAGVCLVREVWIHGIQVTHLGGWPAPFGIVFVADLLSAVMVTVTGTVGFCVLVFSWGRVTEAQLSSSYYALVLILLAGVSGAFLTGDLFNLYVWFEVLLISSFVLLVTGNRDRKLDGAVRYVALNLVSSAFFLAGLGLLYGKVGTLNMADVALRMGDIDPGLQTVLSIIFLSAFGIKAAAFPFFFWLPSSYDTPPVDVSALFGGLLTKVGVYAMIRMFSLIFTHDTAFTHGLILGMAVLTMVTGVIGAVGQMDFRRVLSFHIVSQVGYMLMGLGLFTPLAVAGALFYMVHHMLVKTGLFLVAGAAQRQTGTLDLFRMGGLLAGSPVLAILFAITALSLAGLPPFSGFFAKLVLVRSGLEAGQYVVVGASLVVSVLTLVSMNKLWETAFWRPASVGPILPAAAGQTMPIVLLTMASLGIGLGAAPFAQLCLVAADQLMDPGLYITAVLGGR